MNIRCEYFECITRKGTLNVMYLYQRSRKKVIFFGGLTPKRGLEGYGLATQKNLNFLFYLKSNIRKMSSQITIFFTKRVQ